MKHVSRSSVAQASLSLLRPFAVIMVTCAAASASSSLSGGLQRATHSPSLHVPPPRVFGAPPAGANATTIDWVSTQLRNFGAIEPFSCTDCSLDTAVTVSGLPDKIWDVDVTVQIQHSWNSDLTLQLAGPGGVNVVLANQRGGPGANGYYGKRFDDSANALITETVHGSSSVPEGALSKFNGMNPNWTWRLLLADGYCGLSEDLECSQLEGWTLHVTTLDTALGTSTVQAMDATPAPIPNPGIVTSTITVTGAQPSLCDVNLTTGITHEWCGDLKISLTSPAGTTVMLGSGNGFNRDHVFNGTVWDDQAPTLVTQGPLVNNQVATPLVGEGKLAKFIGEDPNGIWTLTVEDLTDVHSPPGPDAGTLQSWALELTSCFTDQPGQSFCFGDGIDPLVTAACTCGNFGAELHGCANSVFAHGALLTASGTTNPNTVLFTMTGVPNNTLATGFRNTTNVAAGFVFGDGVRCQTGALLRFGSHNTGTFGDAAQSWTAGAETVLPGLTRYYLVQYRNSIAGFCPPETFNVSNGYRISW